METENQSPNPVVCEVLCRLYNQETILEKIDTLTTELLDLRKSIEKCTTSPPTVVNC